jgi:hypothetical protein
MWRPDRRRNLPDQAGYKGNTGFNKGITYQPRGNALLQYLPDLQEKILDFLFGSFFLVKPLFIYETTVLPGLVEPTLNGDDGGMYKTDCYAGRKSIG